MEKINEHVIKVKEEEDVYKDDNDEEKEAKPRGCAGKV